MMVSHQEELWFERYMGSRLKGLHTGWKGASLNSIACMHSQQELTRIIYIILFADMAHTWATLYWHIHIINQQKHSAWKLPTSLAQTMTDTKPKENENRGKEVKSAQNPK